MSVAGLMLSGMGEVWARRGDEVAFGVVPFGEDHPCSSLAGRWHVVVVRPGRPALPMSPPVSEEEARARARAGAGVDRGLGVDGAPHRQ